MRDQIPILLAAAIATFLSIPVCAQTPPNLEPSTSTPLEVTFANTSVNIAGSFVPISSTTVPPVIMLTTPSSSSELLLIMFDLDTPYGPGNNSLAPYLHWLQPSIPTSGLSVDISNATQAPPAPYLPPQPPPISPPHRFVILVYAQSDSTFSMPPGWSGFGVGQNRSNFDVEAFQAAAGLATPIAGTWFEVAPATNNSATASTSAASSNPTTFTGDAGSSARISMSMTSVTATMMVFLGLLSTL